MNSIQPDRNTAILSGNLLSTGGQNPIVRIVWGDEDRGANVSALSTWDNIVEISTNQGVGSFSTTITIPNQEKIYYFRSVAENAGGSVVSRSLGVFTPSAVVGASELRGRWSFDDDNFSSSVDFSNLKLWLDANDSSTIIHSSDSVSQWNDKSGNDNHALQSTTANQPTITSTGIQFDGSNDGFTLTNDISEANLYVFIVSQGFGYVFSNNGTDRALFFNSNQNLYWTFNSSTEFDNVAFNAYLTSTPQLLEFSLNSGTATLKLNDTESSSQGGVSEF